MVKKDYSRNNRFEVFLQSVVIETRQRLFLQTLPRDFEQNEEILFVEFPCRQWESDIIKHFIDALTHIAKKHDDPARELGILLEYVETAILEAELKIGSIDFEHAIVFVCGVIWYPVLFEAKQMVRELPNLIKAAISTLDTTKPALHPETSPTAPNGETPQTAPNAIDFSGVTAKHIAAAYIFENHIKGLNPYGGRKRIEEDAAMRLRWLTGAGCKNLTPTTIYNAVNSHYKDFNSELRKKKSNLNRYFQQDNWKGRVLLVSFDPEGVSNLLKNKGL